MATFHFLTVVGLGQAEALLLYHVDPPPLQIAVSVNDKLRTLNLAIYHTKFLGKHKGRCQNSPLKAAQISW